jgi:hypothetical protein
VILTNDSDLPMHILEDGVLLVGSTIWVMIQKDLDVFA